MKSRYLVNKYKKKTIRNKIQKVEMVKSRIANKRKLKTRSGISNFLKSDSTDLQLS